MQIPSLFPALACLSLALGWIVLGGMNVNAYAVAP